jgi:single-stranded-DNA-specific exonuclease
MNPKRYVLRHADEKAAETLAGMFDLHPVTARVLTARGIATYEDARCFLRPRLDDLHDPSLLPDGEVAISRIERAVRGGERIAVFGDDDCDGITGTALLVEALRRIDGDVRPWIPDRKTEGFGLHADAVDRLLTEGCRLIVTVDGSVRSHYAVGRATDRGADVIITDHHEPDESLPKALAVVDPKREDSWYSERELAGAGIALKLAQGIFGRFGLDENELLPLCDLAALGTLADRVPAVGENRTIAALGFPLLRKARRPGIAVMSAHGYSFSPGDGWPGALFSSLPAEGGDSAGLRLLLASSEGEAESEIETLLRHADGSRQGLDRAMVEGAKPDAGALGSGVAVAVLSGGEPPLGAVASRLHESTGLPAAAVLLSGAEARVEYRGPEEADFPAMLRLHEHLYDSAGGHKAAAGGRFAAASVEALKREVIEYAEKHWSDLPRPEIEIDCELSLPEVSPELSSDLTKLAPYGRGNPPPCFITPEKTLLEFDGSWRPVGAAMPSGVVVKKSDSFQPSDRPSRIIFTIEHATNPVVALLAGIDETQLSR